jgi:hypothetical protein
MKKSTFLSTIAFAFIMLLSTNVTAQKFADLDKSPLDISANKDKSVKVVYSRPQLKGRALSKLAPNDKLWRTGANESSEITFTNDVTFGGLKVKAGTYSLFTIPGDGEWTIILNSSTGNWGAYGYKEENDVVRVKGKVSSGDPIEAFSIAFDDDGNMHLGWGTVRVKVPIS